MTMRSSLAVALVFCVAASVAAQDGDTPTTELDQTTPPPIDLLQPDEVSGDTPEQPITGEPADADPFMEAVNQELDALSGENGPDGTQGPGEGDTMGSGGATDDLLRTVARVGVALCVVVAVYLIGYYLLKRFGRRTPLIAGAHLGKSMGRVYLAPRVALHFVRIRDRVLVVGVTPTAISRVAEFDADLFEEAQEEPVSEDEGAESTPARKKAEAFLAQLRDSAAKMDAARTPPLDGAGGSVRPEPPAASAPEPAGEEDEIAALRDGILRLQQQIQDTARELDE